MKPITYEQALYRIAAWCSKAERCRSDVRRKLSAWELTEGDIRKLIKHLEKERFLDESRYARAFVHDKSRYNGWGIHKIRNELKKKGVPDSLISENLGSLDTEENFERLRHLLANKRKTVKGVDEFEIRNKLIRFALGRGYDYDEIMKALR
mgnify:CR=1 FL=1